MRCISSYSCVIRWTFSRTAKWAGVRTLVSCTLSNAWLWSAGTWWLTSCEQSGFVWRALRTPFCFGYDSSCFNCAFCGPIEFDRNRFCGCCAFSWNANPWKNCVLMWLMAAGLVALFCEKISSAMSDYFIWGAETYWGMTCLLSSGCSCISGSKPLLLWFMPEDTFCSLWPSWAKLTNCLRVGSSVCMAFLLSFYRSASIRSWLLFCEGSYLSDSSFLKRLMSKCRFIVYSTLSTAAWPVLKLI